MWLLSEILQTHAPNSTWHLANNEYIFVAIATINITESLVCAKLWDIVFASCELAA